MLIRSSSHPTFSADFVKVHFCCLLGTFVNKPHSVYSLSVSDGHSKTLKKSLHTRLLNTPLRPLKTADLLSDDSLYYDPSILQASQGFPVQRRLSQACQVLRGEFLPTAFKCHDRLSGKTAVRRAKRRTWNRGHSGTLRASEPGSAVKRQMPQLAPVSS